MSYLDYSQSASRSPGSRNYSGAGFASGLSLPRQTQRPFDAPLGTSALYGDRSGGGFNSRGMDTMGASNVHSYMLDNTQQAWNYGGSGAATVNGAMNGPNRQRSVNRRAALPQVCASIHSMNNAD